MRKSNENVETYYRNNSKGEIFMKKKIIVTLVIMSLIVLVTGCSNHSSRDKINNDDKESRVDKNMKVTINGKEYIATVEDNETVKSFISKLPQEFNMDELNGNEKYIYMDQTLPTNSYNPKHIEAGDIMLYGSDCLVIFYKSFDTKYQYTKIGHIDNLPDLGSDNIKVKFEI